MGMLVAPYRHATASALPNAATVYTTGGTGGANAQFASEALDRGNWHDASDTTRLTAPSSGLVRLAAALYVANPDIFAMTKNGAAFDGRGVFNSNVLASNDDMCGHSAIISATAGDYFQVGAGAGSGAGASTENWFGIEALDSSTRYALARRSTSNQSMAASTPIKCVFNDELTDPHGFYDPATGTISLPAGRWRVTCCIETASAANGASVWITDAAGVSAGSLRGQGASAEGNFTFNKYLCATTAVLEVASSQTLSVYAISGSATSLVASDHTWVCVEEVPDYTRCLLYRSASQSIPLSTTTLVSMDTAVYGGSMMSSGGIQVPSGVTEGRFSISYDGPDSGTTIAWGAKTSDNLRRAGIPHDHGAGFYNTLSGLGMWRPVTPGEIYGLYVFPLTGGTTLSDSVRTWIGAEFR